MYLLYRSIVPYEKAMPDFRLRGALFFPAMLGFALGVAHIGLDGDLISRGYGGLAYLLLYPAIATYGLIVVFNRALFVKKVGTAVYFGVGGGALALGLAFVDVYRSLSSPARALSDFVFLAEMLFLASAIVLFHSSKGLLLGTYFAEGRKLRGVAVSLAVEVPFGAFYLTGQIPGVDPAPIVAFLFLYGAAMYYLCWHVFFVRKMPGELRRALDQERKRERRVLIAKRAK